MALFFRGSSRDVKESCSKRYMQGLEGGMMAPLGKCLIAFLATHRFYTALCRLFGMIQPLRDRKGSTSAHGSNSDDSSDSDSDSDSRSGNTSPGIKIGSEKTEYITSFGGDESSKPTVKYAGPAAPRRRRSSSSTSSSTLASGKKHQTDRPQSVNTCFCFFISAGLGKWVQAFFATVSNG